MHILIKLEVAKKQAYIFKSTSLKDNVSRSNHIAYVTSSDFFGDIANDFYKTEENLVYSGGGHSVLKFDSKEKAVKFTKVITKYTLENFNGLELFSTSIQYDESLLPKENLMNLSKKLEEKKSIRKNQFQTTSIGIESLDKTNFSPISINEKPFKHMDFNIFNDFNFPMNFKDIDESFLSVIHIDGNAMGKRIENIYKDPKNNDFDTLAKNLNNFSKCIQKDFETAFENMLIKVTATNGIDLDFGLEKCIPIRPIILAGDDVCFVTKGSMGLECSRIFLEELANITNEQDKTKYSACAGVAIIHSKFPFYKAYNLSEELCNSAKKFGIGCNADGSISAIDWHIEYGQMKNHLSEIREDYICDDNNILTLRPMAVVNPKNDEISIFKNYNYFKTVCKAFQTTDNEVTYGKLKEVRQALKQGIIETDYAIENANIGNIIYDIVSGEYGENVVETILDKGINKEVFKTIGDSNLKYCSCFDAIEMIGMYAEIKEGV